MTVHAVAVVLPYDDAFIIFRYVDNFWKGEGPVYNPGERVFGISSPLFAAWLAVLKGILPGVELSLLASRGNAALLVAFGLLAFFLARRLGTGQLLAEAVAAAVMLSEGILRVSIGGMEAPLYLTLLAGSMLALVARRDTLAVFMASLACLARPEGALLVGIVLAAVFLDRDRMKSFLRAAVVGLTPLALWIVVATWYYGTPIPHSIVAKARPLYPLPPWTALSDILSRSGRWALDGIHLLVLALSGHVGADEAFRYPLSPSIYRWTGVALLIAILLKWLRPIAGSSWARLLAMPIYFVALVAGYALSNPGLLLWYFPLVQAPLLFLGLAPGPHPRRSRLPAIAGALVCALLLVSGLSAFVFNLMPSYWSLLRYGGDNTARSLQMASYERAARWIGDNSQPGDTVAATEIGIIGYLLDRRILDSCGLVTPEAIPFIPAPPSQRGFETVVMPVGFVRETLPDFIVSLPAYIGPSLLRDPWFGSAYRKVHEVPCMANSPRSYAVLVFQKVAGASGS